MSYFFSKYQLLRILPVLVACCFPAWRSGDPLICGALLSGTEKAELSARMLRVFGQALERRLISLEDLEKAATHPTAAALLAPFSPIRAEYSGYRRVVELLTEQLGPSGCAQLKESLTALARSQRADHARRTNTEKKTKVRIMSSVIHELDGPGKASPPEVFSIDGKPHAFVTSFSGKSETRVYDLASQKLIDPLPLGHHVRASGYTHQGRSFGFTLTFNIDPADRSDSAAERRRRSLRVFDPLSGEKLHGRVLDETFGSAYSLLSDETTAIAAIGSQGKVWIIDLAKPELRGYALVPKREGPAPDYSGEGVQIFRDPGTRDIFVAALGGQRVLDVFNLTTKEHTYRLTSEEPIEEIQFAEVNGRAALLAFARKEDKPLLWIDPAKGKVVHAWKLDKDLGLPVLTVFRQEGRTYFFLSRHYGYQLAELRAGSRITTVAHPNPDTANLIFSYSSAIPFQHDGGTFLWLAQNVSERNGESSSFRIINPFTGITLHTQSVSDRVSHLWFREFRLPGEPSAVRAFASDYHSGKLRFAEIALPD